MPSETMISSEPITTVGQYHRGSRFVIAVARVTPVQISQRRMIGVPRLAIACRRIRWGLLPGHRRADVRGRLALGQHERVMHQDGRQMGAQTGHQPSEEPRNGGEIGSEVHRIGRNDERLRVVRVAVAEPPEDLEFRADRLQLQLQFAPARQPAPSSRGGSAV